MFTCSETFLFHIIAEVLVNGVVQDTSYSSTPTDYNNVRVFKSFDDPDTWYNMVFYNLDITIQVSAVHVRQLYLEYGLEAYSFDFRHPQLLQLLQLLPPEMVGGERIRSCRIHISHDCVVCQRYDVLMLIVSRDCPIWHVWETRRRKEVKKTDLDV